MIFDGAVLVPMGRATIPIIARRLQSYGLTADGAIRPVGHGWYYARVVDRDGKDAGERWLRNTRKGWQMAKSRPKGA